ncbi:MAG: DUF3530 family protein [Gammaproteobacteria bacterium]|nr:DUF3530 family protein [Gammaproteobacteria bacterium]
MTVAADSTATRQLEAAWRDAANLDGELVELSVEGAGVPAIFRPYADGDALGGVVLLHDPWTHADSHEVIRPLRLGLAEAGWNTLSVQLPAARSHATAADWQSRSAQIAARAGAGLDWLKQRGLDNRAVIALGESAAIALRFAATRPAQDIAAVILISSPATFDDEASRKALEQLSRPLLDLYAQRDLETVVERARKRAVAARAAGVQDFEQREVSGATPGFAGLDPLLVQTIHNWLRDNAATDQR